MRAIASWLEERITDVFEFVLAPLINLVEIDVSEPVVQFEEDEFL